MIDKNLIKKLDIELEKFVHSRYNHLDDCYLENIIRQKKDEIVQAVETNSIELNTNNIQNILEEPIHIIAYNNFKQIIHIKEEKKNKIENVSYSNAYKCFKCGNNKTSIVYVQTRSCDEPMTAFVKCIKCQNQFIK